MNLIKEIESELSDKDWDDYTKARYLYIKSCENFTYDSRYYFCDSELREKILNRKIDLENLTDNRVVCTSWSNEVYMPLLKQIGLDGIVKGKSHQEVEFKLGDHIMKADSTSTSDLVRVKMNLTTYGFKECSNNLEDKLKLIDRKISYIDNNYKNKEILMIKDNIKSEFEKEEYNSKYTYNDNLLIYKLYKIKEIVESFKNLKFFEDYRTCIYYLIFKFFEQEELEKIKDIHLCFSSIEDGDLGNLFTINLANDILYFTLKNTENGYVFYEILEDEAKHLAKNKIECRR